MAVPTQTTLDLYNYYPSLLIFQYLSKPKAYATIQASVAGMLMIQTSTQQISYSITPTSGTFTLSYDGNTTSALNFDASDSDIQTALQALPGLSSVTVNNLLVSFTGVTPPASLLTVASNSLQASGVAVAVGILETDLTLPLAVQNAYNLTGPNTAVGIQLDVIGKYAGVTRVGAGINGQIITLNDAEFLLFIKMAIVQNNSGSSLYDIATNMFNFFGTEIIPVDTANMNLTYLVSSLVSDDLLELFITENLLPHPMGVGVSIIIYAPVINSFFGFVTYDNPTQPTVTRPFNDYDDYQTDWPWFSYADVHV